MIKKRREGDKKLKNKLNLKKDVWINLLLIFKYKKKGLI